MARAEGFQRRFLDISAPISSNRMEPQFEETKLEAEPQNRVTFHFVARQLSKMDALGVRLLTAINVS